MRKVSIGACLQDRQNSSSVGQGIGSLMGVGPVTLLLEMLPFVAAIFYPLLLVMLSYDGVVLLFVAGNVTFCCCYDTLCCWNIYEVLC